MLTRDDVVSGVVYQPKKTFTLAARHEAQSAADRARIEQTKQPPLNGVMTLTSPPILPTRPPGSGHHAR